MRRATTIWAAAFAVIASMGSVEAHHSYLVYQTTAVWVKGTVVGFEYVNPHALITLEDRNEDGLVRRWAVEGPPRVALDRRGIGADVVKIGDTLEFCGFPYKAAAELARIWPEVDYSTPRWSALTVGSSPRYVAGHVMVMPNGAKRMWEPHGLISACMRISEDQRQSWLDFLKSNTEARQAWCEQQGRPVQANDPSREYVEEIARSIGDPCK